MAIRAIFPPGATTATADKPLHQWDYGQRLEIEADNLPALVEVHFEYEGIEEAIVRPCATVGGIGTVAIPDICLEQSSEIVAWIFCIDGTAGSTEKRVSIKVKARIKPQPGEDIPTEISDKYTEVITAVNDAVKSLEEGDVVVEGAKHAKSSEKISVEDYGEIDGTYLIDMKNGAEVIPKADQANTTRRYGESARRHAGTSLILNNANTLSFDLLEYGNSMADGYWLVYIQADVSDGIMLDVVTVPFLGVVYHNCLNRGTTKLIRLHNTSEDFNCSIEAGEDGYVLHIGASGAGGLKPGIVDVVWCGINGPGYAAG